MWFEAEIGVGLVSGQGSVMARVTLMPPVNTFTVFGIFLFLFYVGSAVYSNLVDARLLIVMTWWLFGLVAP